MNANPDATSCVSAVQIDAGLIEFMQNYPDFLEFYGFDELKLQNTLVFVWQAMNSCNKQV